MKPITVFFCLAISLNAQQPPRPRVLGVAHIAIFVHDFEKSRKFYHDFLGFEEPYSLPSADSKSGLTFFKVNERQYIEMFPEKEPGTDRLNHISIETDDAEGMYAYLRSKGVKLPPRNPRNRIGNASFTVQDPEGHGVEITQYEPDSLTARAKGKFLPATRISQRMMHVGIIVTELDREVKFYSDILGFREIWRGSKNGKELSWTNLKVPDGNDYVEFMLYKDAPPPTKRGSAHHLCLEVPDVNQALAILNARPYRKEYTQPLEAHIGVNRKRIVNIFDPDGTRTEVMEPVTIGGNPAPSSTAPPPAFH